MWIDAPTFELPANVALTDQPNTWVGVQFFGDPVTIDSALSALTIQGDGAGITGLNAGELITGTVPLGRLGTNSPTSSLFLRGDNTWAEALTAAQVRAIAAKAPFYPEWTPTGIDDEFDDASFSGWTRVDKPAGPTLVVTESNDRLSIYHPGGDGASELHAFLRAQAGISVGDWWEMCFMCQARNEDHFVVGPILTDGTAYGSGNQWALGINLRNNSDLAFRTHTGFNSNPGSANQGNPLYASTGGPLFLRMYYSATNTWQCLMSTDGISYGKIENAWSHTLAFTVTHVGFHLTTWGGAYPRMLSVLYFRKGNG